MGLLARLGANLDLPDSLRLPRNRPVVMAGNHRSLLDLAATMAIFSKFDVSSRILVRQDMVENGLGGRYLRSIGCIPTSTDRREQAEAEAVAALQRGHIVSLMPEGRLVPPHDWSHRGVGPGRPGVSRIATAVDAVVVPVGFTNTEKVWPRGRPPRVSVPRPQVFLRVGDAIEMESTDHQENADRVMDAIADLGRYSRWVKTYAATCSDAALSAFLP